MKRAIVRLRRNFSVPKIPKPFNQTVNLLNASKAKHLIKSDSDNIMIKTDGDVLTWLQAHITVFSRPKQRDSMTIISNQKLIVEMNQVEDFILKNRRNMHLVNFFYCSSVLLKSSHSVSMMNQKFLVKNETIKMIEETIGDYFFKLPILTRIINSANNFPPCYSPLIQTALSIIHKRVFNITSEEFHPIYVYRTIKIIRDNMLYSESVDLLEKWLKETWKSVIDQEYIFLNYPLICELNDIFPNILSEIMNSIDSVFLNIINKDQDRSFRGVKCFLDLISSYSKSINPVIFKELYNHYFLNYINGKINPPHHAFLSSPIFYAAYLLNKGLYKNILDTNNIFEQLIDILHNEDHKYINLRNMWHLEKVFLTLLSDSSLDGGLRKKLLDLISKNLEKNENFYFSRGFVFLLNKSFLQQLVYDSLEEFEGIVISEEHLKYITQKSNWRIKSDKIPTKEHVSQIAPDLRCRVHYFSPPNEEDTNEYKINFHMNSNIVCHLNFFRNSQNKINEILKMISSESDLPEEHFSMPLLPDMNSIKPFFLSLLIQFSNSKFESWAHTWIHFAAKEPVFRNILSNPKSQFYLVRFCESYSDNLPGLVDGVIRSLINRNFDHFKNFLRRILFSKRIDPLLVKWLKTILSKLTLETKNKMEVLLLNYFIQSDNAVELYKKDQYISPSFVLTNYKTLLLDQSTKIILDDSKQKWNTDKFLNPFVKVEFDDYKEELSLHKYSIKDLLLISVTRSSQLEETSQLESLLNFLKSSNQKLARQNLLILSDVSTWNTLSSNTLEIISNHIKSLIHSKIIETSPLDPYEVYALKHSPLIDHLNLSEVSRLSPRNIFEEQLVNCENQHKKQFDKQSFQFHTDDDLLEYLFNDI